MIKIIAAFVTGFALAIGATAWSQTNPCGPREDNSWAPKMAIPSPGDSRNCMTFGAFVDCR